MWGADAGLQKCPRRWFDVQWGHDSERLRLAARFFIFEISFFAAYSYAMSVTPRTGAPFWAPDAVLLCALLLTRPGAWWIWLAATLPLRLVIAVPVNTPAWFLFAAFANDSLKAVLAAALLRRFLPPRGIRFDRLHDFWVYLSVAVGAAPALSGVAGAATWFALGRAFWPVWSNWYFGDALANLVLTPGLLCVAHDWRKLIHARGIRYLEGAAVFGGLFLAIQFAAGRGLGASGVHEAYEYVPVAFLLLAAVRFGPAGASLSLTMMSLFWMAGRGGNPPREEAAIFLSIQLFLMVIGVPIMSLAVLLEQQRRTEESLRESEGRFRQMADTAPVMIWISGPDRRATFFNKGWLGFTGRTERAEAGFGWAANVHPNHREDCMAGYTSAFDSRRAWNAEWLLRRADGEYRWLLFSGAPRFSADGAFDGYIVSSADITEIKSAQEASSARQKLESLGVLAGGVAHDFNNLLGGIHANAELAEGAEPDGNFPHEEIQNIKAISMRASGIVRQLMIYAGNEGPNVELLDLSRTVREMLDLIRISISKSAVLMTDLGAGLPSVLGNGPQIQQVVMNLVLNASDSLAGKDGVVTVRTVLVRAAGAGNGSAAGTRSSERIRLEVSDTGCGIDEDAQARIFDPFFTTKMAGRGLGLAVVQGVVRAHKGVIEIDSTPGKGTTFGVLFPTATHVPERIVHPRRSPAASEDVELRGTVMVVEDEEILRNSVGKMLRKHGMNVLEAGDGTAAVELLRNYDEGIDVVLLDMTIPGTPSRAVLAEACRWRPGTKLVLMSAYSQAMVWPAPGNGQIKGFLRKPFAFGELMAQIRGALAGRE